MTFESREDAGRQLGQDLAARQVSADLVLGLPRGGVIVAAEVARVLQCPLDVLVVRKIGHPLFPEFAVGALGENGVVVLDKAVLNRARLERAALDETIADESRRMHFYQEEFARPDRLSRAGASVIIVDDGLATGATLEAAVLSARKQGVQRIVVAVPVASTRGAARISKICDEFHSLVIDSTFQAVGQFYNCFNQTTDEEVQAILGISS